MKTAEEKSVKERSIKDLLMLVCELHSRALVSPSKDIHDAFVEARKEIELRLESSQQPSREKIKQILYKSRVLFSKEQWDFLVSELSEGNQEVYNCPITDSKHPYSEYAITKEQPSREKIRKATEEAYDKWSRLENENVTYLGELIAIELSELSEGEGEHKPTDEEIEEWSKDKFEKFGIASTAAAMTTAKVMRDNPEQFKQLTK